MSFEGKFHTIRSKRKMRLKKLQNPPTNLFEKGYIPWNKGMKYSMRLRIKIGRGHKKENQYIYVPTSPLYRMIRDLTEFEEWRDKVYKRDNYTCQNCGKNKKLIAHHIKYMQEIIIDFLKLYSQFSLIEDKETLVRLSLSYEPFWNIDNGITLCESCHKIIHYSN